MAGHAFTRPNTKYVLSLGGGAARGIVGNFLVIYLLEKLNLLHRFDEIWGVSAGAVIGAAAALNFPTSFMIKYINRTRNKDLFEFSVTGLLKNRGFFKTEKVFSYIDSMYYGKTFTDCKIPFFSLSVEIGNCSEQLTRFSSGSLTEAIVASLCLPEIFEPIEIDGKKYVDGGLIENIPSVSVLQHHRETKDARKLAILAINFGETHLESHTLLISKLLNILDVTRFQLQLDQVQRIRDCSDHASVAMINIDIPIGASDFNKMGSAIIPSFRRLLEKLTAFCDLGEFNCTI
jgi:predicted acylesterase/phospholipase RssA